MSAGSSGTPPLLVALGIVHAVLVVSLLLYLGFTYGVLWGLAVGTVYTLVWVLFLVNRRDQENYAPVVPSASTIYRGPAPGTED